MTLKYWQIILIYLLTTIAISLNDNTIGGIYAVFATISGIYWKLKFHKTPGMHQRMLDDANVRN